MEKKHRSTADWDFSTAAWSLDLVTLISAPSSLRFNVTTGTSVLPVLLKHAVVGAIAQGKIDTWLRGQALGSQQPYLFFRAQAADGGASPNDSYAVTFTASLFSWLYRDAGGVQSSLGNFAIVLVNDTWQRVRITWWEGKDPWNVDATVLRLDFWDGASWIQQGVDLYDTNRRNWNSARNRPGVGMKRGAGSYKVWFDDTYIYGYP